MQRNALELKNWDWYLLHPEIAPDSGLYSTALMIPPSQSRARIARMLDIRAG
jgi:hypothetical protein